MFHYLNLHHAFYNILDFSENSSKVGRLLMIYDKGPLLFCLSSMLNWIYYQKSINCFQNITSSSFDLTV